MQVTSEGSVRVDLVGGTLDLEPINLILPNVVTLNVATTLKAKVTIQKIEEEVIKIHSLDYNQKYEFKLKDLTDENLYYSSFFKEMSFVMQIISLFSKNDGLALELSSGAPAGSGLGGSSAMGMTLFKALSKLYNKNIDITKAVQKVKGIEGRILNQGMPGYQDYYPAMLGGVLCLKGEPGEIKFEQLYSDELKTFMEKKISLIYSGISRDSGINNWDVYKSFFDKKNNVRSGLEKIAKISYDAYQAIKLKNFDQLLKLIGEEGLSRKALAENIVPDVIESFSKELIQSGDIIGMKMCGAGGGGCFIITHDAFSSRIQEAIEKYQFKKLDFIIEAPLL